jgi:GntR family transcriptional regulator/MocR family aminotransferase
MSKTPGAYSPVITLDRKAAKPLHRQIYEAYRTRIIARDLQPGQQVPSSRSLAAELRVSRIPVLNAYSQLLAESYFESRVGAGTFVSSGLPEQLISGEPHIEKPVQDPSPRITSRGSSLLVSLERPPWITGSGAFSVGQLAFDHFPFQIWSNLVARRARKVRASSLNYGDPTGLLEFRRTLATYLRTSRAVQCEADQIILVSGSQQALDLSARVLLNPESAVWMEEPGYGLARSALRLAGSKLIPVPVDSEGLDVAAGIRLCPKASAAYVTPSHQFPLGSVMSASRRLQILDWAHSSGAWIIEDDYDSEYRYESMPIASLQGMDHGSRVIYIGTFSKTLFPSLRLGYLVVPPDLAARFVAVRRVMDICPPHFYQAVLADFMDQGHFARHIRKTRLLYSERRDALANSIRNEFGGRLQILGAEAGMHLTVALPPEIRDYDIAMLAALRNLWLWPLSTSFMGKSRRQGFILGFGGTKALEIPEKIRLLRDVLNEASVLK